MLMLRGQQKQAQALRYQLLRRDGFWISYAYIAAWHAASGGGGGTPRSKPTKTPAPGDLWIRDLPALLSGWGRLAAGHEP